MGERMDEDMTDATPIPSDNPMVQVASLLDDTVDKLYALNTTLGEAHREDRCDLLTFASASDTLMELVGKIEDTRKNLSD